MALGKRKHSRSKFSPPKLMLTSMMDMFTIILIFLLFSFSAETEKLDIAKEVELPRSSSLTGYADGIRIVLSDKELRLNDEVMAVMEKQHIRGLDPENPKASSLFKRLASIREDLSKRPQDAVKDRHVLFLCDKRHTFKTINAVIKTAGMAGYPIFQFAVLEGRKDDS